MENVQAEDEEEESAGEEERTEGKKKKTESKGEKIEGEGEEVGEEKVEEEEVEEEEKEGKKREGQTPSVGSGEKIQVLVEVHWYGIVNISFYFLFFIHTDTLYVDFVCCLLLRTRTDLFPAPE